MGKILHIVSSLECGGEEIFLLDIYPFLSKQFEHVICPFVHTGELYTNTINIEKSKNSRFWIYVFKSRTAIAKILKSFLLFYYSYRMWRFIKNEKPDIIITCTPMAAYALVLLTTFTIRKRKFKWYSRIGSHIDPINARSFFSPNKLSYRIASSLLYLAVKLLAKRADCMIVVNRDLMKEVMTISNADIKKFFLLPVCVSDSSILNKQPVLYFPEKQAFFVAAGRLEYIKGFDFLIKTFSIFSKNKPNIKLIIFGEGSKRNSLEKLIKSLRLTEKILLPGYIKNPAIIGPNAIAYIVPSRSEGFGKIIVEAMQTSSIVIASDCAGPREIITDKHDGILFESENSAALLDAMNYVMQLSAENKAALKKNAYQQSLQYSPERIAKLLNAKLEMECVL